MKLLLTTLIVLVLVWLLVIAVLLFLGKRTRARVLTMMLPNLVRLFRGLLTDERVPRKSKWLLLLALAWLVSPIDILPEFIPVLGPLDDVVVAVLVLRHLVNRAGPQVVRDHWQGSDTALSVILRLAGRR